MGTHENPEAGGWYYRDAQGVLHPFDPDVGSVVDVESADSTSDEVVTIESTEEVSGQFTDSYME